MDVNDAASALNPSIDQAATAADAAYDPLEKSTGAAANTALQDYQGTVANVPPPPVQSPFLEQPVQDHFAETQKVMPFLFAMAALGGRATKASGMTMLGSMTGMQKGLIQGNQEAYEQSRQKYEDAYRKWREDWESKRDTYEMYLKAYQPRIDASKIAWEKAEKVHDDVSMAKAKAYGDAKTWASLSAKFEQAHTAATNAETNKVFKEAKIPIDQENADAHRLSAEKSGQRDAKKDEQKKKVVGSVLEQLDQMDKALDETSGLTGVSGLVRRGVETAKTATGLGDQNAPAQKFATLNNTMLSELPVAMGLSSRSAKDQREKLTQAADMLRSGATGPIAKQQIETIRSILKNEVKEDAETIAVNPKTGAKMRLDKATNKWVPLDG